MSASSARIAHGHVVVPLFLRPDTAILKLMVDTGTAALYEYLAEHRDILVDVRDMEEYFVYFKKLHGLATFYMTRGMHKEALAYREAIALLTGEGREQ